MRTEEQLSGDNPRRRAECKWGQDTKGGEAATYGAESPRRPLFELPSNFLEPQPWHTTPCLCHRAGAQGGAAFRQTAKPSRRGMTVVKTFDDW